LYRWLDSNHTTCPVCKAGVTRENIIPLYGKGGQESDPRGKYPEEKKNDSEGVPPRPAAERPEPSQNYRQTPQNFMNGFFGPQFFGGTQFGNMSFSAGFGFFPSIFGLQFQTFQTPQRNEQVTPEESSQIFYSQLFMTLGIFIIVFLLFFLNYCLKFNYNISQDNQTL